MILTWINRTWMTLVYDQVPWLSYYTKKFPSLAKEFNAFRAMSMRRTEERCKQGSITKDLFYYLVSHLCPCYPWNPGSLCLCARSSRITKTAPKRRTRRFPWSCLTADSPS